MSGSQGTDGRSICSDNGQGGLQTRPESHPARLNYLPSHKQALPGHIGSRRQAQQL